MTQDNGATWTALAVTPFWAKVEIPAATLANPVVGFRIVTSGDAVDIALVQHETGLVATSSIPTTSAAVTRNADNVSIGGTDFSSFFDPAKGTVFASARRADSGVSETYFSIDDGSASNNRITAGATTTSKISYRVSSGNVDSVSPLGRIVGEQGIRMAVAYAPNDWASYVDGTVDGIDVTVTLPSGLNKLSIGQNSLALGQLNGVISELRFYPKRLSDAELQALTGFPVGASIGDLFVDENDRNRVYQFDGTAWNPVVSNVAEAIADQAPAATDATIEGSADVTKAIQGLALIDVAYDHTGAVKTNQFPILKTYRLMAAGAEITSGVTWAVATTSGGWSGTVPSISGTGSGQLSINSGPNVASAQVRVSATLAGRTYDFTIDVRQKLDDPPISSGGATASQAFGLQVDTSWIDATGELVGSTGAGITNFDLTAANANIGSADPTPPANGSSNVQGQWLWWDGAAWQTVGTIADSNPDVAFALGEESSGSITVNRQKTGLTGGTQYKFKLQFRISTGLVSPVNVSGTASIEGGT